MPARQADRRQTAIEVRMRFSPSASDEIGDDIGHAILDERMTPADRVEAIDIGRGLFGPRNNVQGGRRK